MSLPEEAKKYAPVLERMVELLGSNENMKFGDAMTQASTELGLTVPKNLEGAMLTSAFLIIGRGKIPGLPDA